MIQKLQNMRNREEGFTLIELMVVVLIIAILIAIAIPTFLGARGRAQDRASQSSLRNSVTAAKAIFTDNEDYEDATVAALVDAEPALTFAAAATDSTDANDISVFGGTVSAVTKSSVFYAAALSANGEKCWYVRDAVDPDANPGTWWAVTANNSSAACSASDAAAVAAFDTTAPYTAGAWVKKASTAVQP